jgi:hypothetical protein
MPPTEPLSDNVSASRRDVFSFLFALSSTPAGRASLGKLKAVERLGGTVREQVERSLDINVDVSNERLGVGLPLTRIFADFFGNTRSPFNLFSSGSCVTDVFAGDAFGRWQSGYSESTRPGNRRLPADTQAGDTT